MKKILLVEDELEIRRLVELHLVDVGYEVEAQADGAVALKRSLEQAWDLVILDLTLPNVDGLDICRSLRSHEGRHYTPILMLTARSAEIDRVLGLETGADDYLTKPFSVRELVARVKAILRRAEAQAATPDEETSELIRGGLVLDRSRRSVSLDGETITLTAKEFDLLYHFALHPGRVYTRSELLESVWGYGHGGYEHTVNSHINRLRSKIEASPAEPAYVQTVWGVGYRFAEDHELHP